jgi:N-formylglutamate amidohydrolase
VIRPIREGGGPLVAVALHDGHELRPELAARLAVGAAARLREEDPHTGEWTAFAPHRLVVRRSRFEVDLNRARDAAVYRRPEDAWGLRVWSGEPEQALVEDALRIHDAFYAGLHRLFSRLAARFGRFVVYDLHSYNHRRAGPSAAPADPATHPQVNVGTGSLADRACFAPLIDRFQADLRAFPFPGGALDVRENVRFRGGYLGRWTHQSFPEAGCVLSIEVKKFFMDEWTGELDPERHAAVGRALAATAPGVLEELERLRA